MSAVLQHYRLGPANYQASTLIYGGQFVQPTTLTAGTTDLTIKLAASLRMPLTPRGSGTGLSGGCTPVDGGLVVSFERMNRILEIDTDNHVAVVEPGVTLADLDAALLPYRLVYPVFPGEVSASLGGNVATNAGGMRAVDRKST